MTTEIGTEKEEGKDRGEDARELQEPGSQAVTSLDELDALLIEINEERISEIEAQWTELRAKGDRLLEEAARVAGREPGAFRVLTYGEGWQEPSHDEARLQKEADQASTRPFMRFPRY